jgi:hypothetical protein
MEAGASASEYADEAWSVRVGGVTPQHSGRLRRVYQRFGEVYDQYPGLYWSHFQAAVDWADAEMWLEGAAQNRWSVAQLRRSRWETLGALPDNDAQDLLAGELDEDFEPGGGENAEDSLGEDDGWGAESPAAAASVDFRELDGDERAEPDPSRVLAGTECVETPAAPTASIQPFTNLSDLPPDLSEALESFKLAILRHKAENWAQIARTEVLATLDALKALVLAPQ